MSRQKSVNPSVVPASYVTLRDGEMRREKRPWRAIGDLAGDFAGGLFRSYDLRHCIRGSWPEGMCFENVVTGSVRQVRKGVVQPVANGVMA